MDYDRSMKCKTQTMILISIFMQIKKKMWS